MCLWNLGVYLQRIWPGDQDVEWMGEQMEEGVDGGAVECNAFVHARPCLCARAHIFLFP
jgi:hypothetical protein